jgi:flagellar assembly protein FliH
LYNKVFKNYQINLGTPFQVKAAVNLQASKIKSKENKACKEPKVKETPEDIMGEAKNQADLIINEAELEAQRIVEKAYKKAEELKIDVEREARQKGYDQGFKGMQAQYEEIIREAEAIRENAKTEYNEVLSGMESDIVSLIFEVAKKVIGRELSENRDAILSIVRQAVEKCSDRNNLVLKVSAEDYDFLLDNREKLISMVGDASEFDVKKDSSVKAGSCVIETSFGTLDGGVGTKIRKIEESFMQLLGS